MRDTRKLIAGGANQSSSSNNSSRGSEDTAASTHVRTKLSSSTTAGGFCIKKNAWLFRRALMPATRETYDRAQRRLDMAASAHHAQQQTTTPPTSSVVRRQRVESPHSQLLHQVRHLPTHQLLRTLVGRARVGLREQHATIATTSRHNKSTFTFQQGTRQRRPDDAEARQHRRPPDSRRTGT